MEIHITKKDVLWGYIAQFFNIGAGILLLPVILKLLPADILGVWYIFLTISSLVQMIDFGFQPTFTRNVAYVFSGAVKLQAKGLDKGQTHLDHPNYPLLKNMISVMKRFYGGISLLVIFLLLTAGSWYIDDRTNHIAANEEIMISWFIYTTSTVLNLYYSYYNALLVGRGLVKENNQLIIHPFHLSRFSRLGSDCRLWLNCSSHSQLSIYYYQSVGGDSFFLPKRSPQNPPEYPSNKRKIITYFMGKCQKKWIKQFGWIFCPKRQFAFHIYVFTSGNSCQLWSNR